MEYWDGTPTTTSSRYASRSKKYDTTAAASSLCARCYLYVGVLLLTLSKSAVIKSSLPAFL
uniref:Uncharacterized protein n=1 Tax=Setaria italica TaxID=4555 RepID=K4AP28_SETIT